jgi:DNA-binding MarR family transcriptional regulator
MTNARSHQALEVLQAELFGTVFVLAQHLGRMTDAALEPLGLTSRQWLLLAVLTKAFPQAHPTLTEAAAAYGSSRQNVKMIALQLRERGYLELVPDPSDRRALRLHLTPKVALFDQPSTQKRQQRLFSEVFDGLPAADVEALHALVRRWARNLAVQAPR